MSRLGWTVLFAGLLMAAIVLLILRGPSIPWLGRLPGDIRIEGEHRRFHFPIATCLVLSLLLSALLSIVGKRFR